MHGLLFKVSTGRSCPGGSDAPGNWSSVRLEEGCGPSEGLVQEAGYMYLVWCSRQQWGWAELLPALLEVSDF